MKTRLVTIASVIALAGCDMYDQEPDDEDLVEPQTEQRARAAESWDAEYGAKYGGGTGAYGAPSAAPTYGPTGSAGTSQGTASSGTIVQQQGAASDRWEGEGGWPGATTEPGLPENAPRDVGEFGAQRRDDLLDELYASYRNAGNTNLTRAQLGERCVLVGEGQQIRGTAGDLQFFAAENVKKLCKQFLELHEPGQGFEGE